MFRQTNKISQNLAILGLTGQGYTHKDIKKAYHAALLKWHPDVNPAGLEMSKLINAAWDFFKELDDKEPFGTTEDQQENYAGEVSDALAAIIDLADIEIEVCGTWIWISGDTKAHRGILKENGFKYHGGKTKWYMAPAGYVRKGRRKSMPHSAIQDKYGSQRVKKGPQRKAIA